MLAWCSFSNVSSCMARAQGRVHTSPPRQCDEGATCHVRRGKIQMACQMCGQSGCESVCVFGFGEGGDD